MATLKRYIKIQLADLVVRHRRTARIDGLLYPAAGMKSPGTTNYVAVFVLDNAESTKKFMVNLRIS
jgi:hypothetical protein